MLHVRGNVTPMYHLPKVVESADVRLGVSVVQMAVTHDEEDHVDMPVLTAWNHLISVNFGHAIDNIPHVAWCIDVTSTLTRSHRSAAANGKLQNAMRCFSTFTHTPLISSDLQRAAGPTFLSTHCSFISLRHWNICYLTSSCFLVCMRRGL